MRILIDLQSCQSGSRLGGIGRYSLELAKAMVRVAPQHDFTVLLSNLFPEQQEAIRHEFAHLLEPERFLTFSAPSPVHSSDPSNDRRRVSAELLREHVIRQIAPDVVHISSLVEGWGDDVVASMRDPWLAARTAITWYDLIPFVQPEMYLSDSRIREHYFRRIEEAKRASMYLAISAHTASELVDCLEIPSDKVINIRAGVDARFKPATTSAAESLTINDLQLKELGIKGPFLLYTGSFDARKNQAGLIEAFGKLPEGLRKQYQLVIAGNGWEGIYKKLGKVVQRSGLDAESVIFTGHISDDLLLELYRSATLFVFPSLREGFGLPALEAMACGTAAIGSNCTSVPEVIGREDALFDPKSVDAIAAKMQEVLTSPELLADLREHGIKHAAEFTWDKAAKKAIAGFETMQVATSAPVNRNRAQDCDASYQGLVSALADQAVTDNLTRSELETIADCIEKNELTTIKARSLAERFAGDNPSNASALPRVGWVTPWASKCGIASYSKLLVDAGEQPPCVIFADHVDETVSSNGKVERCWTAGKDDLEQLAQRVAFHNLDAVIIQFNYGFFRFQALREFILRQVAAGREIFVVLHSTQDPPKAAQKRLAEIADALSQCSRVLVHTDADIARLQSLGVQSNITLIPHGLIERDPAGTTLPRVDPATFTIATYGFFLPHKGLLELIEAFARLSADDASLRLRMVNSEYPAAVSRDLIPLAKSKIQTLGIADKTELVTDFLEDAKSLEHLSSADLIVFPYQQTGESSSAAVRMGLASRVPVAVTPLPIFADVESAVEFLPGCDIDSVTSGLADLISRLRQGGDKSLEELSLRADHWRSTRDVRAIAKQLANVVQSCPRAAA